MLKSLLVGVNESRWSERAVELSLHLAATMGVRLTYLGIVDSEGLTAGQSVPIGAGGFKARRDAELLAAAREGLADVLAAAAGRAEAAGIPVATARVEGTPADVLSREAQRHDLLIIGKRAVPRTDRDPAPSTTLTDIVRMAPRPIVVTGRELAESGPVVVGYDGSTRAARALASFVKSGMHADRALHLVGIGRDPDRMRGILQRAEDYLAVHGRTAESHILPVGDGVSQSLERFTLDCGAAMLVMGVYGEGRLRDILFGSVTRGVLAAAPTSLFLDR